MSIKDSQRILIIGSPGSGKSTLAKKLGAKLYLPTIHLDQLNWKNEKETVSKTEFLNRLAKALQGESWIIDGNYASTLSTRAESADTVIWLDFNRFLCIYRVIKRFLTIRFTKQPLNLNGNPNLLELDFLLFIWNFKRKTRPSILQLKQQYGEEKLFLQIKNRRALIAFLESL